MTGDFKQTDEILFKLINNDDRVAFAQIYNRYWDKLYNVACSKLDDYFLAEDVVQELFIEIWKSRKTIHISGRVNTYLAAALKYKIIKARLAAQKRTNRQQELAKGDNSSETFSAQDQLAFAELKEKIEKLVRALPDKCRLVYQLSREEGLSAKEISHKLDLSTKTVESHLYRALKSIRENLSTIFIITFSGIRRLLKQIFSWHFSLRLS